ncbi:MULTISPECIES: fatty acid--CoA ligase [Aneurinibacillus]|uniref:Fatty acid--CoA ligase n=1 Tax=Aneurinibacillus thermoaerophilus TaxID=143495 RepID=A0A1G7WW64_ANETH|nr:MULTISPECIES: fatty acid--CoA ligase [Aneurinibacillus]AMA73923.1 long-chain fatty acid--CoA ligase [Aneurinibacillus sp. XH2]MED0678101.1 fatty acid--CoA ligase [Aneurinibacillus thermoaerophilus]MED0737712.1 fatty acid--CoA ligase [Aneurinibacillus thermoaerophilus]MED0755704.1 fatty acid--CoA ligase [Aneurinibacillus thermoaerophilus]MED0759967.1 fatty acid--CoA ligase [Aneurinibacillus thermoaerophilus]
MSTTIGDVLEWSVRNFPDKISLIYEYETKHHRWTYTELNQKVNQFARALKRLGVQKGDVVSSFLYNTSEFVVTLFATAKIGAIFNPINYRLAAHELQYILQDGKAKVLLYERQGSDVVEKARELGNPVEHYIYVDEPLTEGALGFYELLEAEDVSRPEVEVSETDYCIMMYTSGTTGRPKGVLHTHRSKIHHNFMMMQCMGLTKDDIGLAAAPLNHTAELHTSFLPRVQVGATNVLLHHFDASRVLYTIEKEKVTHMFAAPTMVNMLLYADDFEAYDLSSLRLLEYGGASMAPVLIREFEEKVGADLIQIYGTTEMGPCMSVLYADEQLKKAGSAGKASLTHELRICRVNPDGTPTHPDNICEPGEIGEILVKGPCMMEGYYNRPEATEKALAYGWYHTGDMGEYDEDGYIWIRDRIDHMIISGAENIYPREVEDQLLEHPGVREVAVVGKPDPKWGQIVFAYIVRSKESNVTAEELDTFLVEGERLAKYKRPRAYCFVDELPKTASGKIQKFLLEKQAVHV